MNLGTCGLRYLLFTSKYLQSDFQILSFNLPVSRRDFPVTAQGTFAKTLSLKDRTIFCYRSHNSFSDEESLCAACSWSSLFKYCSL